MAVEEPRGNRLISRVILFGGAAAGVALVVAALTSEDAPGWWLVVGIALTAVFGTLTLIWIWLRARYTPEERQARLEELSARAGQAAEPVGRSKLAYRATKHKREVLRSGEDATAIITFIADGGRANEFRKLVYLELEVTPARAGAAPYEVRTGEFVTGASAGSVTPGRQLHVKVDPTDPQQVAVDWEQSLRL